MINAATLDTRIRIESPSTQVDSIGQPLDEWLLVTSLWASVRHLSGTATIKAGADSSTVKASFRCRYMAGIDAGMRIMVGAINYNIVAVLPNKREGYIDIVAEVIS